MTTLLKLLNKHNINKCNRYIPFQLIRHNQITTCLKTTKESSQRGIDRANLNNKYSIGDKVEGDFTVTNITPITSYDCTAFEVNTY